MRSARWHHLLEPALTWITLVALVLLLYARFFEVPYAGLYFSPEGLVSEEYVDGPLQVGDYLRQVGPVRWEDFQFNPHQTIFQGVERGDSVPLVIERNGVTLQVDWVFPGPTPTEFWSRLYSEWPLAFAFWLAGAATLLVVRPRDTLWRLLIYFNLLTAIWLIAGSTVSRWHIWEGALILRVGVWLALPVYLHLHWSFPRPLGRLPRPVLWGLYLAGAVMAGLEVLQQLPRNFYLAAFAVTLVVCVLLLLAHAAVQPQQRRQLVRLVSLWVVAFLPAIALGVAGAFLDEEPSFSGGALLGLPAVPAAYLYAAFRRRLGPHEVRANRLLAYYLVLVLWLVVLAFLVPLAESRLPDSGGLVTFGFALVSVIVGALAMPAFQRWMERRLLGATWRQADLVEKFAERITTSLETPSLVRLLTREVLPSLLVRQSALLRLEAGRATPLYADGVELAQLPTDRDLPALLAHSGLTSPAARAHCAWVLVSLPLRVKDELMGVWLLGRRDPDDNYGAAEVAILQTLAHQTAIALTNIIYAKRLHALYRNAIDQREAERTSLSRELHDSILQRLFDLRRSVADEFNPALFDRQFEAVVQALTQSIRGLRPPMLDYGLYHALVALVDDWANRPDVLDANPPVSVTSSVPESEVRYPHGIELHLYRIVQQAGDNALMHAHARHLTISGRLDASGVDFTIEDDGIGFNPQHLLDVGNLETQGHYGLAGMRERAALIGARLEFDSAPGQGTRLRLIWQAEANEPGLAVFR